MSLRTRIWIFIALLSAFGARVYRLDGQSLWNDEGTSLALAQLSLPAIINGAARDIHPPLYYFLLHYWIPLAGISEFAIRFLSVGAGVLVIALTFRLAREFFGAEVGIIAAFLSALSAFQVYYSQETRMYIWVSLWATLSIFFFIRYWFVLETRPAPDPTTYMAFVLATTAAIYTHYFAAPLIVVENIFFVIIFLFQPSFFRLTRRAALGRWVISQLVVGLAFLPWFLFTANQLATWPAISEPFTVFDLAERVLTAFATNGMLSSDSAPGLYTPVVVAIFFLVGLSPLRLRLGVYARILLSALWVIVPTLALYLISLQRPAWNAKFLLFASPAFYILVARGIALIYPGVILRQTSPRARIFSLRSLAFVLTGIVFVGMLTALQNYFDDPRYARDDYRTVIQYINRVATANDAVVVNAPGQLDVVKYYFRSDAQIEGLPVGRPLNQPVTLERLDALTQNNHRLYEILYAPEQSDPQNVIGNYLTSRAFIASDEWFGNLRLAQYALPALMQTPLTTTVDVEFANEIGLANYALGTRTVRDGDILPFVFEWHALTTPRAAYKIFVHLLDARNNVVAQHDAEPFDGARPTDQWRVGETLTENFGIVIPLTLAPGTYQLEFGLYRADTGQRLSIFTSEGKLVGDHFSLGPVDLLK